MTKFKLLYYVTILILFMKVAYTNTLSLSDNENGTWNIEYMSDVTISGFQFNVDGAVVNSAVGGDAEVSGFMISTGGNTVLGFSLTGATIPPGEGILLPQMNVGGGGAATLTMSDDGDPHAVKYAVFT